MTDPTINLDERGHVKMLKIADLEVKEVLVLIQDDDTLEEPVTLDITEELTEEEFNKLSASDKMKPTRELMASQGYHPRIFIILVT